VRRPAADLAPKDIQEVIFGNVVGAGMGQAPARQAARGAGCPDSTVCTTVNKVCSSGMKTIFYAAQSIALGHHEVVVAGGMESMSNAPYLLPSARYGSRLGHGALVDAVLKDGLWDPYNDIHMGSCAEATAKALGITRAAQDEYAAASYARARAAAAAGHLAAEIVPVPLPAKGKQQAGGAGAGAAGAGMVTLDEEWAKGADAGKMAALRPAFGASGTITAANASKLNDGAAALVLMSAVGAAARGITPLARIRGYADAEQAPIDFSTSPALAVPIALRRAGAALRDCSAHEVNEAFSSVALANMRLLGLEHGDVNVHGGAVALGHPIGASGARIVGTLLGVLRARGGALGTASICNGGGGGSAIVLERLA
jgi:acetyl-CoA C-acetyltransferase